MINHEDEYPKKGLIAVFLLIIMGIGILYITGINDVSNIYSFKKYISSHGLEAMVSVFFIFTGIYCLILYINNVFIKPKEEIIYLEKIEDKTAFFIDFKGKRLYYDNNNYVSDSFYKVKRTRNKIHQVIELVNGDYETPEVKESYWLNFYSPAGNFENIFLLPIVYVIFIPGLLSFIASKGLSRIWGLILMATPLSAIIYDGIYKIKKYNNRQINEVAFLKEYDTITKIIVLIITLAICIFLISSLFVFTDIGSIITVIPFIVVIVLIILLQIFNILGKQNIEENISKAITIVFLLMWFTGLIVFTVMAIKSKEYSMFVIIIPFYLAGFYEIYDKIIKK